MSILNLGAGFAAAGDTIAKTAGAMSLEALRSDLEEQRTKLAAELAEGAATRGRAQTADYEMDRLRAAQAFQEPAQKAQIAAHERQIEAGERGARALEGGGPSGGPGESYGKRVSGFEGGGEKKMVPNELGSGAYGPYQFMPGTWNDVRSQNPDLNLPEDMKQATPEQHKAAFDKFTAGNAQALQKSGVEPTPANLYLAHRFGAAGAEKVAKADDNAPLASILPPEWQNQNPDMRGQTVGSFKRLAEERMKGVSMEGGGGMPAGVAGAFDQLPPDLKKLAAAAFRGGNINEGLQMVFGYLEKQQQLNAPGPDFRTAQALAKATPEERAAYNTMTLTKAGMPAWAAAGGTSNSAPLPGDANVVPTGAGGAGPEGKKAAGQSQFNEKALEGLPPETVVTIKSMVDGRMPSPSSFAAAKPYWQAMIAKANEYDPTFDQTTWASRVATRKDFTAGRASIAVTALNTALGHAGVVADNLEKLDNSSVPALNSVANAIGRAFGSDKQTNAEIAVNALAAEARKVFAASGGGNLTELQEWQKIFPINGSPEQQKGAMKQFVELLDSRLSSLSDQYNRGMGRTDEPLKLLEPKARAVYEKLIGRESDSSTGYQTGKPPEGTAAATQAPVTSLPPMSERVVGRTYSTPSGPMIWREGGWERAGAQ